MDRAVRIARAAGDLVGTPFRLQGRDPSTGLDCIGLVLASLAAAEIPLALPADYRPHRRRFALPHEALAAAGLIAMRGPHRAGDVLLLETAPAQVHAAVAVDRHRIVHAHAGLRRVVESPLPDHWRVLACWRAASGPQGDTSWQR
ncbi:C40 family peptidase [Erythrobacter sp. YJ-T3-07]|uniref:NlpC/P60 family protein n=1 Tax=Erythrobacter sp. YJ-T3-07 TaxID=2793063 RepID=UPI0018D349A6|nr:NlpC/P60 family protein [Erythrobacter sp. YJ-T3-07]MBH1942741.1 C40 family peptidase [Erythrobacter sp. YJ-T3-07]